MDAGSWESSFARRKSMDPAQLDRPGEIQLRMTIINEMDYEFRCWANLVSR